MYICQNIKDRSMKKGLELIAELEAEIKRRESIQDDRFSRIANHEMDLDDCFISVNATNECISELKLKIKILESGGVSTFGRLATIDGKIIENSRIIETKYGECWLADGVFVNIPSFGCKAGKDIWVNAGFKNHADARNQLMAEINTITFREKNDLYYKLGNEAQSLGFAEKGYKVVGVEKPAWVTMKSGNSILRSYPCIFESDFNYFTGE